MLLKIKFRIVYVFTNIKSLIGNANLEIRKRMDYLATILKFTAFGKHFGRNLCQWHYLKFFSQRKLCDKQENTCRALSHGQLDHRAENFIFRSLTFKYKLIPVYGQL